MPKRYPEEFRRKVLDLVAAGRPIAEIAHDLQVSDQTIYGLAQTGPDRHGAGTRTLTPRTIRAHLGEKTYP